jgi:hypothetical protein
MTDVTTFEGQRAAALEALRQAEHSAQQAEYARQEAEKAPRRAVEAAQAKLRNLEAQEAAAQHAERRQRYELSVIALKQAVSDLCAALTRPDGPPDFVKAREIGGTLPDLWRAAEALAPDDLKPAPRPFRINESQFGQTVTEKPFDLLREWVSASQSPLEKQIKCGLLHAALGVETGAAAAPIPI